MKQLVIISFSLVFLVMGCTTWKSSPARQSFTPDEYLKYEMALTLTQDSDSCDLVLSLKNTGSQSITNFFDETLFEGSVWILQEGAVPLRTMSTNFFYLATHVLWSNPLKIIAPGESLNYRIPLDSLQSPFSNRRPDPMRPVLAYAKLEQFRVLSNAIRLEKLDRIQWRTRPMQ